MSNKSYIELRAELEALEDQLETARKAEFADVVTEVRQRVQDFGLTARDIFGSEPRTIPRHRRTPPTAKYRHPDTGHTWSGRGRQPKWIAQAADREQYRVA
ncbi:H-NS histone family protein [Burkholderia gladioli]|uniref:H-NS histone family protein n=1 Tax=Burkholderia gladioli TaxID=28095 RepID=UPI001641549E|nr:H-NS histone family protein [Burkholderia gladioli]MDN7813773.1 H-NS histone family protein [Burkholderia gladioli]